MNDEIMCDALVLADGDPLLPSNVAEASEAYHLAHRRPTDVARQWALLDALDFAFQRLRGIPEELVVKPAPKPSRPVP